MTADQLFMSAAGQNRTIIFKSHIRSTSRDDRGGEILLHFLYHQHFDGHVGRNKFKTKLFKLFLDDWGNFISCAPRTWQL